VAPTIIAIPVIAANSPVRLLCSIFERSNHDKRHATSKA
jgi:hypothetical protein